MPHMGYGATAHRGADARGHGESGYPSVRPKLLRGSHAMHGDLPSNALGTAESNGRITGGRRARGRRTGMFGNAIPQHGIERERGDMVLGPHTCPAGYPRPRRPAGGGDASGGPRDTAAPGHAIPGTDQGLAAQIGHRRRVPAGFPSVGPRHRGSSGGPTPAVTRGPVMRRFRSLGMLAVAEGRRPRPS